MPSTVTNVVFSEPAGRLNAVVMFSGALVFASLYAYNVLRGDAAAANWLLVMIAGCALSGIAESLPKDRRQMAGTLRVTAILVFASLIASVIVAPEFVVG
ncbi:hypothetical protein [Haloplanus aerogenes]|uniref:Uncharacterized protein n=1 Tax=Haloplanus aerogenes TaxID=660522 RepID=A0A3M0DE51_9EURY|nr:hypothetical protein [Haloplanus aerogenes]AZH26059.1 hypothetical protein DU502_12130 [Haloplanus aerogenes]RMB18490.1 hypothetical protein ATH50_1950 [Haloplanus aerogenes]